MCRSLLEGGRRCAGPHRSGPNRSQRADRAFEEVDDLGDDRVPPQRPSVEALTSLSAQHLRLMSDAWREVDANYAMACLSASQKDDELAGPSALWSAPASTRGLFRRLLTVEGAHARMRSPERWESVVEVEGVSRQGADEQMRPDGSGILRHPDGRWLAYRVTVDPAPDSRQVFVTGRVGDAPLSAVEAVQVSQYDRGRLGLPTGDPALDSRGATPALTAEEAVAAYPRIAGIRAWVPNRGAPRYYINNWPDLAGWNVAHYKTGNISSAVVRGERISNTQARARLDARAWIEEGRLLTQRMEEEDVASLHDRIVEMSREHAERR